MHLGHGDGRMTSMVFNTFTLSVAGEQFLESPLSMELPSVSSVAIKPASTYTAALTPSTSSAKQAKQSRSSKGMHLLPVLRRLLSSRTFWYSITSPTDHHFPGVFQTEFPQRLGHCDDITKLSFYTSIDEYFLFSDIQLRKGKPRNARKVTFDVNGTQEEMWYRIAPCAGAKICTADCSFVTSTRELKCPLHPNQPLCNVGGDCSVEFVYVWPDDHDDKRHWLSGLSRTGDLHASNLHNHPLHGASKIPSKVIHDIREKVAADPTIKTHDIITGKCIWYVMYM